MSELAFLVCCNWHAYEFKSMSRKVQFDTSIDLDYLVQVCLIRVEAQIFRTAAIQEALNLQVVLANMFSGTSQCLQVFHVGESLHTDEVRCCHSLTLRP